MLSTAKTAVIGLPKSGNNWLSYLLADSLGLATVHPWRPEDRDKGGVTIFLQGLRNRLAKSNVSVVTIKPGFVDTPMTADVPKNPLFAKPETVGRRIYDVMRRPKDTVYVPWIWRPIMNAIKAIPEWAFKSLSL